MIEIKGEEDNQTQDCLQSQWLILSSYTDNADFRKAFEGLTNNRVTADGSKQGTIYYTSAPTLQTSFKNKAFINHLNAISKEDLTKMLSEVYIDIDTDTASTSLQEEELRAIALDTYFNLFNEKKEGEYNLTQKVSRQDFLAAFLKATTSPTEDQANLTESEQAGLIASKSFIGNNETNNTEQGKITKAEAAYLIANTLFNDELSKADASGALSSGLSSSGNIATQQGYDKYTSNTSNTSNERVATLQYCITNNKLDDELYKSLKLLEEKGIISSEYSSNWNKTISKGEAISLIVNALSEGSVAEGSVDEDVIAEELAEAKSEALEKINAYEYLGDEEKGTYKEQLSSSKSLTEVENVVASAESQEAEAKAEAERAAAQAEAERQASSNSSYSGSGSMVIMGGGNGGSGSSSSSGSSGLTKENGWSTGKGKEIKGYERDPNKDYGISNLK